MDATQSKMSHKTSFLDLPAEMRNQIYRYCLVARSELLICGTEESFINNRESALSTISFAPSILQTATQVHAEAQTILYGENTFFFQQVNETKTFLGQIGNHAKLIRLIRLQAGWMAKTKLRAMFTAIKKATGLTSLSLALLTTSARKLETGFRFRTNASADKFSEALGPLMRKYQREHKDKSDEDVLRLLCWEVVPYFYEPSQQQRELMNKKGQEFGNRVEELLVRTFK